MQFKPNLDLLVSWEEAEKIHRLPYIAVFKKDNKTLVYVCDNHGANISFDMVDFCLSAENPIKPEVAVVEFHNVGRAPTPYTFHDNSLMYMAAKAANLDIPVVYADLSDEEMIDVLKKARPNQDITKDTLHKALTAGGPSKNKNDYNLMSWELNMYGRDPYMLKNIATALSKYDTVLAIFGEGHYRSQRLVIEDMMGKPEYITNVPNTRGDFNNIEIKPIKLID